MAIKLGWLGVRAPLSEVTSHLGVAPLACEPPDDHLDIDERGGWTIIVWCGWGFAEIGDLAALTSHLAPTASFFVYDARWSYAVWHEGACVAYRTHAKRPALHGDLEAAERLCGMPAGHQLRWLVGDPSPPVRGGIVGELWASMTWLPRQEAYRLAPEHDHPPWDEHGHRLFAAGFGLDLAWGPSAAGTLYPLPAEMPAVKPPLLPRVTTFDPVAWRRDNLA